MIETYKYSTPSPLVAAYRAFENVFYWIFEDGDPDNEEQREYIYANVLEIAWKAHGDGVEARDVFAHLPEKENLLWAARGLAMYCAEVGDAVAEGHQDAAWKLATDASWYAGFFSGVTGHNPLRENAKKAADARHAEDREIAERIKAWYIENHHRYDSADDAATAAIRVEPVKWRTARKHITAARKKLPSARKE